MRAPYLYGGRTENAGGTTTVSRGTTITASGTANTKGSYTQLLSSTVSPCDGILVMLDDCAAAVDYLIDISVGGAGSEVIIAPDLLVSGGTGSIVYGGYYYLPCRIPAGTRLAARCQASTLSSTVRVSCLLLGQGYLPGEALNKFMAYGNNAADSGGVSVDPGGTANTKGAYSQIVASTTYPIKFLTVAIGSQVNATRSSQSWLMDVAVGGAGSEVVIISNLALGASTTPDVVCPQTYVNIPVDIPAGTRLSVRAQSDGIDATDRLFDVILYGAS